MLKFIVLGQIPGTDIQLTFQQVLLIGVIFYGALLLVHESRQIQSNDKQKNIFEQAI